MWRKRVRGNKTSRFHRERRLARAIDLLMSGMTVTQVAATLKVNRSTLWRNFRSLKLDWAERNRKLLGAAIRPQIERALRGDIRAAEFLARFFDSNEEDSHDKETDRSAAPAKAADAHAQEIR